MPTLGSDLSSMVASNMSQRRFTIERPMPSPGSSLGEPPVLSCVWTEFASGAQGNEGRSGLSRAPAKGFPDLVQWIESVSLSFECSGLVDVSVRRIHLDVTTNSLSVRATAEH